MLEENKAKGKVEIIINYADGREEKSLINNTVLLTGVSALAQCLANQIGNSFSFFVSRMIFGSNGTSGGIPKFVDTSRTSLFGATVVSKPVIATISPDTPSQVTFTSVLAFGEANTNLNEMALQMNHINPISEQYDLYSMTTFPDLNKTSLMQITFNWSISFL